MRSPSAEAMMPPLAKSGAWAWARRNLFSSIGSTLVTFICLGIVIAIGAALLDFLVLSASWRGTTLADCEQAEGACYPFVRTRFGQFVYGFYPRPERWRIDAAYALALAVSVLLVLPGLRR